MLVFKSQNAQHKYNVENVSVNVWYVCVCVCVFGENNYRDEQRKVNNSSQHCGEKSNKNIIIIKISIWESYLCVNIHYV